MREGQAKVLSERELSRVVNVVKKKAHAKRNVALLYCSFGLGLRAKEMAALRIKHVLGVDGNLLDEMLSETLFVSLATIKTHTQHIYQKIGISRQVDLVRLVYGLPALF
ncbi:LuxR C-terminal-related transcriptional regulator [Duganella sp. HH105]|uniref:LuxR C-terminal-related transcriptional regulator n=1 Tax=Duganella sp. HH105 TaxID=1781067 RepID=UPI000877DB3E|nr:LuxR C-terminal-related transcriptional regulator [Duganella sp. HH105]OEZ60120.1 hypothetical protein DUGA6_33500 [Duganella sp. HH105]